MAARSLSTSPMSCRCGIARATGTLVVPADRTDQTAYAGAGLRFYVTRRFFVRAEYRTHMVFTSRNENEEIDEWKIGLAFFY